MTTPSESLSPTGATQKTTLETTIENMGLEGMPELYKVLSEQSEETLMALLAKRLQERNTAITENKPLTESQLVSEIVAKRIMHERTADALTAALRDKSIIELHELLERVMERPTIIIEDLMKKARMVKEGITEEDEGMEEFASLIRDLAKDPAAAYLDFATVEELALRRALDQREEKPKGEKSESMD